MTINPAAITTPTAAARARAKAQRKRAYAADLETRDPIGARELRVEADALDEVAITVLDPANSLHSPLEVGRGGELIVNSSHAEIDNTCLVDTVRQTPNMLTAEASQKRTELANEAGVLSLALDTAETIQAANSLDKMLAAQLSALHMLTMKNAATAASFADIAANLSGTMSAAQRQFANIETTRSANAAARASEAFQRGMLTLDRLRNGGKQTIVVQHVTVAEGGQAMVAGTMQPGSAGRGKGR